MIARAIMLSAAAVLASATIASARPLLLSDLPPALRALPNARDDAPRPLLTPSSGWHQEGVASWYGADHAGHRTSSGEMFNPHGLTAAHATLPLGTRLRVVRKDTGDSVVVTINDRIGTHRRVIDLSRSAAEAIGLLRAGTAEVRLAPDGEGVSLPAQAVDEPVEVADADDVPRRHGTSRTMHGRAAASGRVTPVHAEISRKPAPHAARHRT